MKSDQTRVNEESAAERTGSNLPDDHWARHELAYWEAAYDRLREEYLEAMRTVEIWKSGHENMVTTLQNMETWYNSLKSELEKYKGSEATRVIKDVRFKALLEETNALAELWKGEHQIALAKLREWESLYRDVLDENIRLERLHEEQQSEIQRLSKEKEEEVQRLAGIVEYWKWEHR